MTIDLTETLEALKASWMIGNPGLDKAGPSWKTAVENDSHPELALMTLAGQAIQLAMQRVPGGQLEPMPLLPRLRLPPPPWPARQQFRILLRVAKLSEAQITGVLYLFAARGYAVHPIDYMPKHFIKLPDVYASWDAWQRDGDLSASIEGGATIDSENWDAWLPADRRQALSSLRRVAPEAARELIAQKAPLLAAEERLRVVELLTEGLSIQDQQVLETFAEDRSSKVRDLVRALLARIGVNQDDPANVNELAGFFTVTKKLLSRNIKVSAMPLKTDAQKKRREELAELLSLQSLVQGLKLESEAELVSAWEPGDEQANEIVVRMIATTGSSDTIALLASRITSLQGISPETFQMVFERMSKRSRLELLPRVLQNDDPSFAATLTCCQGMLGELPREQFEGVPALKKLLALSRSYSSGKSPAQDKLREGLYALGLLADQATASQFLQEFVNENLFASDPILGILKINQCLPPGESL